MVSSSYETTSRFRRILKQYVYTSNQFWKKRNKFNTDIFKVIERASLFVYILCGI